MPGMFGMSWADATEQRRRSAATDLTNDNAPNKTVVYVGIRVVVILARARRGECLRLPALTRREKADDVDLRTVVVLGIGPALDVVHHDCPEIDIVGFL